MRRESRDLALTGRVVVVAGADMPDGAASAHVLAARGAALVLVGGDAEALGQLAASLARNAKTRVAVVHTDTTDERCVDALGELVNELFEARETT